MVPVLDSLKPGVKMLEVDKKVPLQCLDLIHHLMHALIQHVSDSCVIYPPSIVSSHTIGTPTPQPSTALRPAFAAASGASRPHISAAACCACTAPRAAVAACTVMLLRLVLVLVLLSLLLSGARLLPLLPSTSI